MDFRAASREISDDPYEVLELFQQLGWSDGLPIIPPTVERVSTFLESAGWAASDPLGRFPPAGGVVTAELLAINAVMAGCQPAYLPVLAAAVKALTNPSFNLEAVQTTTHPVAPLVIVHGPIRNAIHLNCGSGLFGPGHRANATIGRAIRLLLINVGGATPGLVDRATQGQPSKYSFCIGENEEESPWAPLRSESAVTMFAGENPHNINDHRSTRALELLQTVAGSIANPGCNNVLIGGEVLVIFGPEHAQTIARDGLSKQDVQSFLFEHALVDLESTSPPCRVIMKPARQPNKVMVVDDPSKFVIIVAGGSGKHSAWMPTFSDTTRSVTEPIEGEAASADCDDVCALPLRRSDT